MVSASKHTAQTVGGMAKRHSSSGPIITLPQSTAAGIKKSKKEKDGDGLIGRVKGFWQVGNGNGVEIKQQREERG